MIQLAGSTIPDSPVSLQRYERQIAVEIKQLFRECVAETVSAWRRRLANVGHDAKKEGRLQEKVGAVANLRIHGFRAVAETAARELMLMLGSSSGSRKPTHGRPELYRESLKQALLCISDCARYAQRIALARASADLARFLDPADVQTHTQFAILAFKGTEVLDGEDLQALFNLLLESSECATAGCGTPSVTPLFKSFVEYIRREQERKSSKLARSVKVNFSRSLVCLTWALITESDIQALSKLVSAEAPPLWKSLAVCLQSPPDYPDYLKEEDLFHVIGSVMFVLNIVSSCKDAGDICGFSPNPRMLIANSFIHGLVTVLCDLVMKEFTHLAAAVKSRRRNRMRLLQKKNRKSLHASHAVPQDKWDGSEILLRLECYSAVHKKMKPSVVLGGLSIFAHFLSKTLRISSGCDLRPFKDLLDSVKQARGSIDKFVSSGQLTPIFGLATSAAVEATKDQALLPQLDEDVALSAVSPCRSHGLFSRIQEQSINIDVMLGAKDESEPVGSALRSLEEIPYQVRIRRIATKHLDALGAKLVRSLVPPGKGVCTTESIDSRAVGDLVGIAIRNQRLWRAEEFLSTFGGGRILRYKLPSTSSGGDIRPVVDLGPGSGSRDDAREIAQNFEEPDRVVLPAYKRRRLAAALTQAGEGSEENLALRLETSGIAPIASNSSPVVVQTPVGRRRTRRPIFRDNEQRQVVSPAGSFPFEGGTPLTLGQHPFDANIGTPVGDLASPVKYVPTSCHPGAAMISAVDNVLYGISPLSNDSNFIGAWDWWRNRSFVSGDEFRGHLSGGRIPDRDYS